MILLKFFCLCDLYEQKGNMFIRFFIKEWKEKILIFLWQCFSWRPWQESGWPAKTISPCTSRVCFSGFFFHFPRSWSVRAVFIGAGGAAFAVNVYSDWLYSRYFGMTKLIGLSILWPLAFILGSLYAFSRSDFTSTGSKLWRFTKITAGGLAAALVLSTGITLADWHFRGRDYMYNLSVRKNDAFFRTKKGTHHYDKQKDKQFRLTRQRSRITAARSNDRVLLLTYDYHREGPFLGYAYELILMNADGSEKELLIQTMGPDTPFSGLRIRAFDISPNGRRSVFTSLTAGVRKSSLSARNTAVLSTGATPLFFIIKKGCAPDGIKSKKA